MLFAHFDWLLKLGIKVIPSWRREGHILHANLRNKTFCSFLSQFLRIFYPTGLVNTNYLITESEVVTGKSQTEALPY